MARGVGTLPGLNKFALGLFALTCTLVPSCAEPRRASRTPVEANVSRVDVFLGASSTVPRLRMTLEKLELVDEDGEARELVLAKPEFSSEGVGSRSAVAGAVVPPARYEAIIIEVSRATLLRGDLEIPLRLLPARAANEKPSTDLPGLLGDRGADPDTVTYRFPLNLIVGRHHAASVFLNWHVEESLIEGGFRPVLSSRLEAPQARLGLLYVTDSGTGTTLAFDRVGARIVATGKVGESPVAVALSRDRRQLFVANAGDGSISILDTQRNLATSTIPIRLSARTSDVVIAEAERLVAVTNPGLDTVSFFGMQDGSRIGDVRVGRTPIQIAAVPAMRRMFALNSRSNDVSVIEMGTRDVVATIPVESTPSCLAISRTGQEVYIGHRVSRNLLVLDATSLGIADSIYVGGNVTAVLSDRRRDRVFVARSNPSEIAIVDRRLSAVIRRIPISGVVVNLAQPIEGPNLYGACPDQGALIAIDVVVGVEKAILPCGAIPSDVVASD